MGFTTWTALHQQMLDDLATGSWRTEAYRIKDREMRYRTFEDFKAALEYVKAQAAIETGTVIGRTYAGQGGRSQ